MASKVLLTMLVTERPACLRRDEALGALQICFRHRQQTRVRDLNGGATVIRDYPMAPLYAPCLFPIRFDPMVLPFSLCKEHFSNLLSTHYLECRRHQWICDFLAGNIASYAIDLAMTFGYTGLCIMADVELLHIEDFYEEEILIPVLLVSQRVPAVDAREWLRLQLNGLLAPDHDRATNNPYLTQYLWNRLVELLNLITAGDTGHSQNGGAASSAAINEELKAKGFKKTQGDNLESCSVCLEDYMIGAELIKLPCSHIFHESCILSWLEKRNSCPLCRSKIDE